MRPCPALGCDAMIPTSLELCPNHWTRVPQFIKTSLREAVVRSGRMSIHHLHALREGIRLLAREEGIDVE